MDNFWFNVVYSVTPTILIGLIFWFVMRAIMRSDRSERASYSDIEREERIKRGLPVDDPLLDQREEDRLPNS
jgi:flagellar biosynthesis/type III secretory pathway M-ring protein FliF/YscJ